MFKSYDSKIRELLSKKHSDVDWKGVLEFHKTMLARIQHERLIHLLVMIFVGLITVMTTFIMISTQKADLFIVSIPLGALFIGYIFHYYFLENTTQSWYILEDQIRKLHTK